MSTETETEFNMDTYLLCRTGIIHSTGGRSIIKIPRFEYINLVSILLCCRRTDPFVHQTCGNTIRMCSSAAEKFLVRICQVEVTLFYIERSADTIKYMHKDARFTVIV